MSVPSTSFDVVNFLAQTPQTAGVYLMYAEADKDLLYIGKAKRLRARLASYFQKTAQMTTKTRALVERIGHIELILTSTEAEALLLEQTLIKKHRPPFNILLRDDKSYPYIHLVPYGDFPALELRRGRNKAVGPVYGPYPSAQAARELMDVVFRIFKIRQCDEASFRHRSRPCLQYQMKRCHAPCMGWIDAHAYAQDIEQVKAFLKGDYQQVLQVLHTQMQQAAKHLAFERAAHLRDQIQALKTWVQPQIIDTDEKRALDVCACIEYASHKIVSILSVRQGRVTACRSYLAEDALAANEGETLEAFLRQYYWQGPVPDMLLTSHALQADASAKFQYASAGTQIREIPWRCPQRGRGKAWLQMALENALQFARQKIDKAQQDQQSWQDLRQVLALPSLHTLMCIDISHTQGEATYGVCVIWTPEGAQKSAFRAYALQDHTPGDDYAAIYATLAAFIQEKNVQIAPELILVDGGVGQLKAAHQAAVFYDWQVHLLGMAKGASRKSGAERLLDLNGHQLELPPTTRAFRLLQRVRDSAHQFALQTHRRARDSKRSRSKLQEIKGIGSKRRQALLKYFGSQSKLAQASLEDLCAVKGISEGLARSIYQHFRTSSDTVEKL
ncbi:excinuclease ABC subunit C [Allopseudospirillum japonicum]|uniref:UvrABC system protein C n=1 Tax=Allopseudospirillum japonicum TaxID=64971 RepID=A0A1H6T6F1_9GAMM|nr:excinuclease ABC subunit UvrC [Allopseudospirillum japonicum]SEI75611.1 excinuclease ABC subunit C [Allopseudospirillum japonicum]